MISICLKSTSSSAKRNRIAASAVKNLRVCWWIHILSLLRYCSSGWLVRFEFVLQLLSLLCSSGKLVGCLSIESVWKCAILFNLADIQLWWCWKIADRFDHYLFPEHTLAPYCVTLKLRIFLNGCLNTICVSANLASILFSQVPHVRQ